MERKDLKAFRKKRREDLRKLRDIDPMTGRPRKEPLDLDENLGDLLSEEEFEQATREHPELVSDKFREYMERKRQGKITQEELY